MYKVFCDEYLIHDDSLESLRIIVPKLSLQLNAVGSFTFTIYTNHPYFDKLNKLKSIIKVYQDNRLIFKGRILNDVNGFYNEKQVTCESDLAFLLDSIQRPYEFSGTPAELFTELIGVHNQQVGDDHKFKIGNVTVIDPNDYITRSDSTYLNTWESINKKLIDGLGGYLWVRYESDGTYLDYLEDFNWLSSQSIEFGKNLIDLKRTVKADDIFTVLIPLGTDVDKEIPNPDDPDNPTIVKEKLTIKEVNDGKDYIEHTEAVQMYGKIVKTMNWNDVTVASNLKAKGQAYLDESVQLVNSIELTAADLATLDKNINSFRLGTKVKVTSSPHGIDHYYLVNKLKIDLTVPTNNKISLGTSFQTMTESQVNQIDYVQSQVQESVEKVESNVINVTTKQLESSIQASSSDILATVSESYYTKEEIPDVIASQTTQLRQDVNGWTQTWTTFKTNYDKDQEGIDEEFEKIEKYIRYIDGKIILGEEGNELELRIANNELGFYQNNSKIAYFSNNALYFDNGSINVQYNEQSGGSKLQLGKFAFIPRSTGNLSFKKVTD